MQEFKLFVFPSLCSSIRCRMDENRNKARFFFSKNISTVDKAHELIFKISNFKTK